MTIDQACTQAAYCIMGHSNAANTGITGQVITVTGG